MALAWTVVFYSDRVETEILALSAGYLARFIRYAERMEAFGPDLGLPHTRAKYEMASSFKQFRRRALARPQVKVAYDSFAEEFAFLDEVLGARAESGLTQAEVAARVGTTQSAIARLESAAPKHSPSIATLQKYARALGYRVEVRLVKEQRTTRRSSRTPPGGSSRPRRTPIT